MERSLRSRDEGGAGFRQGKVIWWWVGEEILSCQCTMRDNLDTRH